MNKSERTTMLRIAFLVQEGVYTNQEIADKLRLHVRLGTPKNNEVSE